VSRIHNTSQSESGAAAVEFAIIMTLLMLLVFGIIEFGFALYRQAILTNAAREGARLGIVQAIPAITTAQINAAIDTYLTAAGINPANVSRNITSGAVTGAPVRVQLTLPYTFEVLPRISTVTQNINLTAVTEMRHE
jgi:Flp pilus assembly protein TadG